jgi:Integrase zinc binding domain
MWCHDMLIVMEGTGDTPVKKVFRWDANGVLSYMTGDQADAPLRWLAPVSLRERILTLGHFSYLALHPGVTRMYQNLSRKWHWPSLARDCAAIVRRCPTYDAQHLKRGPKRSAPMTMFPPDGALEFISMDVLGPLSTSRRGHKYIIAITDHFSKLKVAVPTADQTESTLALAFVDL